VKIDAAPEHSDPKLPTPSAEPEYPTDGATDAEGWTVTGGIYRSPSKAARAIIELHLQWAPGGRVEWNDVEFAKTAAPAARKRNSQRFIIAPAETHLARTGRNI